MLKDTIFLVTQHIFLCWLLMYPWCDGESRHVLLSELSLECDWVINTWHCIRKESIVLYIEMCTARKKQRYSYCKLQAMVTTSVWLLLFRPNVCCIFLSLFVINTVCLTKQIVHYCFYIMKFSRKGPTRRTKLI